MSKFLKMANFSLGDGKRRLGKALPQHKLMQNLLMSDFRKYDKIQKVTKATQTDSVRKTSEGNCCCGQKKFDKKVKKQENKVWELVENRRRDEGYQNLLASIRERVVVKEEECCSCSDTWSDTSTGSTDAINFPKETRNAMSILRLNEKKSHPKFPKESVWPGFAAKCTNSSEISTKIKPRLSKNKLTLN